MIQHNPWHAPDCSVLSSSPKVAPWCLLGCMQVLVVTFTWLFVAPTLTCWLWRLAFIRSFQQVWPAK